MKIKRPKKYVVRCKRCGSVSHVKLKDDCPFCYAIGQGERLDINASPFREMLKLDDDISEVNSI